MRCPSYLAQERALVPIVEQAGWAPGPVWTNIETIKSLPPTRVQITDHPGSSNLLYKLYAAPIISVLFLERLKFNFAFRKWYPVSHLLEYVTGLQYPQNSSGQSLIYSTSIPILPLCFCLASRRSAGHLSTSTDLPDRGNHPMSCPMRTRSSFSVGKPTKT